MKQERYTMENVQRLLGYDKDHCYDCIYSKWMGSPVKEFRHGDSPSSAKQLKKGHAKSIQKSIDQSRWKKLVLWTGVVAVETERSGQL